MGTLEKHLEEVVEDVKAERDTLLAQNRELVEALKRIADWPNGAQSEIAKAAIAKLGKG